MLNNCGSDASTLIVIDAVKVTFAKTILSDLIKRVVNLFILKVETLPLVLAP